MHGFLLFFLQLNPIQSYSIFLYHQHFDLFCTHFSLKKVFNKFCDMSCNFLQTVLS